MQQVPNIKCKKNNNIRTHFLDEHTNKICGGVSFKMNCSYLKQIQTVKLNHLFLQNFIALMTDNLLKKIGNEFIDDNLFHIETVQNKTFLTFVAEQLFVQYTLVS